MHRRGIGHCDLNTRNIFVGSQQDEDDTDDYDDMQEDFKIDPLIGDMGISRKLDDLDAINVSDQSFFSACLSR